MVPTKEHADQSAQGFFPSMRIPHKFLFQKQNECKVTGKRKRGPQIGRPKSHEYTVILYFVIVSYVTLHFIMLYYTVLYYILSFLLNYTISYYILFSIIYYTILYYHSMGSNTSELRMTFTWWNWLWWRVVRDQTIHDITIHNKRIRSGGIDLDEGWYITSQYIT